MYKLLTLDLDGTLLDSNKKISAENKNEIKRLQNAGVYVSIATGRNLANTIDYIEELKIDVPVICSDGSIIYDPIKNEIIDELVLDNNLLENELFKVFEELDFLELATANKYIMYIDKSVHEKYQVNILGEKNKKVAAFSFLKNIKLVDNRNELLKTNEKIHSMMLGGDLKKMTALSKNISDNFMIRKNIIKDHFIINHKELGKWKGILKLVKILNIDTNSTLSIGDDNNDLDMLEHSALGVAMENASMEAKKHADFISLSNDNNGVAFAIKKYF